jgi:ABC-type phosphate/phosphonate transport system permease subunit
MKQKDFLLIGVVVFISVIVSLFVSKAVFSSPKNRQQQVETVQAITSDFPQPDSHFFNKDSIDPTKLIQIGQDSNQDPFTDGTQ